MGRRLRTALIVALGAVFTVSMYMVVSSLIQYQKGRKNYEDAKSLIRTASSAGVGKAAATFAPASSETDGKSDMRRLAATDITALQRVNSDIAGWIEIPGTAVAYPILQGKDDSYYLTHTWNKEVLPAGSIFLETRCSRNLTDFNTILYGHNMKDGSMFAAIRSYSGKDFCDAHRNIYIVDETGVRRYEVFAAYQVSADGKVYQTDFPDSASRKNFLSFCTRQSVCRTDAAPSVNDKILTLSTCVGFNDSVRWVVQGALRGVAERSYTP